jgi:MFS family permease
MSGTVTGRQPGRRRAGRRARSGRLDAGERRLLLVLGQPTLAMAFSATIVSTYLPVVARRSTSSTVVIGLIILGEGLMAIVVPPLAGAWSDRFREHRGSRLTFVLAGAPLSFAAMLALSFARAPALLACLVAAFFAGNFFSYEPYRALYPDLFPSEVSGRAQASQAVSRGLGTVLALAGGGVLLSVWLGLPFTIAALLQACAVALLVMLLPRVSRRSRERRKTPRREDLRIELGTILARLWRLLREDPRLRLYLVANALWELSLGALKTFIVLYVTVGLGRSLSSASLIIGAVAVVIVVGAVVSGMLGDRLGRIRTMRIGLWCYGLSLIVPIVTRSTLALAVVVPFIAFGGGLTMTLPYAILMPLMPDDAHGSMTGFYSLSRGLGVMLGPVLAGAAVQLGGGAFSSTHGYAAMWIVTSAAILLSIPVLGRLARRIDRDERARPG